MLIRVSESILYSLVNLYPYLFLALSPFLHSLRFSKKTTILLIVLLSTVQIGFGIYATLFSSENSGLLSLLSTICYALFYFLAVKEQLSKILFVLFMTSNLANLVVMAGKCLEGFWFPDLAIQNNRWSFSLTSLIIQAIILPLAYLFMKKHLSSAVLLRSVKNAWRYLWLIPVTFYLFWYHNCYFSNTSSLNQALQPINTIFTFLINLGALLVYYIIAMAISYSDENLKLQANNYQLTIQNIQYENLKERMDEVKRARHDLRYHMGAIYSLVQKEEYSKLKEYLEEYLTFSPASQPLSYCSHFALNAVISYYAQLALSDQIRFSAEIATPQDIPISDADLTVLFGSLLENAYNGCLFLPEKDRFIRLKATMPNNNTLVFTIDNSCLDAEEAKKEAEDTRSTTHKGTGVGIESVRNIVDRYGGLVQFEKPKDTFCVSGVLYC